jgi:hypothetical protein
MQDAHMHNQCLMQDAKLHTQCLMQDAHLYTPCLMRDALLSTLDPPHGLTNSISRHCIADAVHATRCTIVPSKPYLVVLSLLEILNMPLITDLEQLRKQRHI